MELTPRYMSDDERVRHAIGLLDGAFAALCYIGGMEDGVWTRPVRVQKALDRIDRAMTALEKEAGIK